MPFKYCMRGRTEFEFELTATYSWTVCVFFGPNGAIENSQG